MPGVSYLSIDIEFDRRATSFLADRRVVAAEFDFQMRGCFLVLATQIRVRALTRHGVLYRFVPNVGLLGHPGGPWPLSRFQVTSGVDLLDLYRLTDLSMKYHHNMFGTANSPTMVRFIPRSHERELRGIAARLASNSRARACDTGK